MYPDAANIEGSLQPTDAETIIPNSVSAQIWITFDFFLPGIVDFWVKRNTKKESDSHMTVRRGMYTIQ
jgi:hypothetical protein